MNTINGKQVRSMAFLVTLGGIFAIGGTKDAGEESYLAVFAALAVTALLCMLYEALLQQSGADGVFTLCKRCLGQIGGKLVIALWGLYAAVLGMMLCGNLLNFIHTVLLPNTGTVTVGCAVAFTVAVAVKCGMGALARTSRPLMFAIFGIVGVTALLSAIYVDYRNFPLPILQNGLAAVLEGAWSLTCTPFGDLILLLPLLPGRTVGKRGNRELWQGAAMTAALLAVIFLRNVLALGSETYEMLFFKSFVAVRLISVGVFFQRIEILVSVIYLVCDVFKLAVCVHCLTKCVGAITERTDETVLAAPLSLFVVGLAAAFVRNERYVVQFLQMAKVLAAPFFIGLPLLTYVAIRLSSRRLPRGSTSSGVRVRGR
ncbi:MAG: GerAB/ArcD/ProY family transporter [Clostridia bacterium]|nr:GerAB/ArcD/ProY family transporter [Clostridia bacterium]